MKIFLKLLQYIFKSIATIFSKLGAVYTYTRIYKYLMRYKFISLLWKPIKYIFTNIIYFIKLASAIISIFSLFNLSIIYYDFDIMNEINDLINKIINSIKVLYNKWFSNNEEDEISDPVDFLHYKKEIKVIEKVVEQTPNNSYWILPLMGISAIALYYYQPEINLDEYINPILSKIDEIIPVNYTAFVTGMFVYKFIAISFTSIFDINIFDEADPKSDNSSQASLMGKYFKTESEEPSLLTDEERKALLDPEETPKASSSKLPPKIENPFKSKGSYKMQNNKPEEIKIENWD
uniref:Uncharacterized protein n=1 Tax=Hemileccinum impolitum TaxID=121045 RepID=A0A8F0WIL2_9AGAM|nr:hypothetical protein KYX09_mgp14 [Xerocomus impolitus]QWM94552.1 hypothetical protein [Xerocomus impolitus]QWM97184.1 hypothetical protein [Xerocomus impolitus]UHB41861.1 hypothetical protein [Xerocomus impolitus]